MSLAWQALMGTQPEYEDRNQSPVFDVTGDVLPKLNDLDLKVKPGMENLAPSVDAMVKVKVFRGHTENIRSVGFCDKDTKILSASDDYSVVLWDIETGDQLRIFNGHSNSVSKARASTDASQVVSSSWDKKVKLWDVETGVPMWSGTHDSMVTCCDFSPDGKFVVSCSDFEHNVKLWEPKSGCLVKEIKGLHTSTITSCHFNPTSDRIFTTSMDRSTKFYDLKSMKNTITLKGHSNVVSSASISADERKLITVSWDKSIRVWDASTGMYRSQGPDVLEKAHEGSISSCWLSQNGFLGVTGGYDNSVVFWDIENMVPKLRLQGHRDWVEDVAMSTDMCWLLSCSKDKTMRLWNIEESDNIPMVQENKKSVGHKMTTCASCEKPFSMIQSDDPALRNYCVFCRLQKTTPKSEP